MAVAPEPEHDEVDRRLIEQRLVAGALCRGVRGGSVEAVEDAELHATQLMSQVGAVAALVLGPKAEVLVELQQRGRLRRQGSIGGVGAQRRVQPERRAPRGQDQPRSRACSQPVGDHLTAQQRDAHRVLDHQWRLRRDRLPLAAHRRYASPGCAEVAAAGVELRW